MAIRRIDFCHALRETTFFLWVFALMIAAVDAEEPVSRTAPNPVTPPRRIPPALFEAQLAREAAEDRAIAVIANEDRTTLEKNLSQGIGNMVIGSDAVPETTFLSCLPSRRLARLVEELQTENDASATAQRIFDDNLRELRTLINSGIDGWEQGIPPQRPLPIRETLGGVVAGLFLCMEHATVDETLACIDRWQDVGTTINRRLGDFRLSDAALERLATGPTAKLVEQLTKDRGQLGRMLAADVGRSANPEPLFLVNVYVRLIEKHCHPESVVAELPDFFNKHQRPTTINFDAWNSHRLPVDLVGNQTVPEQTIRNYTVYRNWGFVQGEYKQKLVLQVRERLESCSGRAEPSTMK